MNYNENNQLEAERSVNALNGVIVTDLESENTDEYIGHKDALSEKVKTIITKQRKTIRRKAQKLNKQNCC